MSIKAKLVHKMLIMNCNLIRSTDFKFSFTEKLYNITCEGDNITLECPKEKPWMQITSATFGRAMDERLLCNRTAAKNPNCKVDVAPKVAEICADRSKCVFNVNNVTFHDPCPPEVYTYMWVTFDCSKYEFIILMPSTKHKGT